ncbi:style cell-cycle inhibitor 1-A-like [Pyrus communis]|uniref:style cell-cycle inhibitor 1-A-like n=1 Tax=Pyrus communis TaxID=23211 RepID=UPI0035C05E1E
MGSDRKSEEKKKSRKRSTSSSSEDEGKGKRQRTVEDEDRKSRRSDKKDKKRSHMHSKHRSAKEKKTKDKHKSKHHKGDRLSKIDFQELSTDDYFLKNNEFSMWLKEEKDVFFSDLSSESARQLFADFVKVWNKQKLESKYYEGIASGPRCAHAWKIKG